MGQYISKDALVAEIIHKIKVLEAFIKNFNGISNKVEKAKNKIEALNDELLFIDSLEAKEVNLDFEQELYKAFGQVKDFTLGMRIAKHFFELGLKAAQKGEHEDKTCKENGDSLTQEEDLKEAAKHYLYSNILYDDVYVGNPTDKDCIEMFKAGAKWQKQKDEKNIGELQWNAHEESWDECKQEMMAKAVKVNINNASIVSLPSDCNLKVGDKVLIIKEN